MALHVVFLARFQGYFSLIHGTFTRAVLLLRRNVVPYPADRDIRALGGAQYRQNRNRLRGHFHSSSATHVCCPSGCIAQDWPFTYEREHGRHGRP